MRLDWNGFVLWSIILSLILFIITYGKYYEWLASSQIRIALVVLVIAGGLQHLNIKTVKRPYISPAAWRYPNLWKILLLFGVIYILQAAPGLLQNPYMAGILHFDQQNIAYLNYYSLAGMCLSAVICYYYFRNRKGLRPFIIGGYGLFILYLLLMYFYINPECNIERFYNVATKEEEYADLTHPSAKYHEKSHGESFLALAQNNLRPNGLYLFDEPEAALSPQRQLTLLMQIYSCAKEGAQFIIVTHSPILLGIPDADIYCFDNGRIHLCEYEDTESYQVTEMFINNRQMLLDRLLTD